MWTVWLKSCPCGGKASRGASASVFPLLSERKSSGRAQWHFLEVNVIPETWRATTVAEWAPGTRINMETDVIGKYVRHMVAPHLGLASEEAKAGKLSVEFLRENGFF